RRSQSARSSLATNQISNSSLNEYFGGRRLPLVEPGRGRQPFLAEEFWVEQPALIARPIIAEYRDYGMAGPKLTGKTNGASDIDAARSAEAETFFTQQVEDDGQGFGVRDLVGLVDLGAFEIGSDAALADPFSDRASFRLKHAVLVIIVERRAHWVREPDDDVGIVFLETSR